MRLPCLLQEPCSYLLQRSSACYLLTTPERKASNSFSKANERIAHVRLPFLDPILLYINIQKRLHFAHAPKFSLKPFASFSPAQPTLLVTSGLQNPSSPPADCREPCGMQQTQE